jgi:heme-degrading monooxygenase HmoA
MSRPVQLHCDLVVDPAKAADAEHYFVTTYRPAAMDFEGYLDLRLLKLRDVLAGQAPAGANYRFSITWETEELRQKWVASDVHQVVWPELQTYLTSSDFDFLLFEVI